MKASVAIITRTKNRPLLLKRAIKSVLDQSFDDWTHVIINDGGDPEVVDALVAEYTKKYKKRIQVIHNKKSLGMEAASNKALAASKSTYVVIHDDDDAWHKGFLSKTVTLLEGSTMPDVGGVVCHSTKVIEKMTAKSVKEVARSDFNSGVKDVTLWRMCGGNVFPPISFLYKREVFDKVGGMYDEKLPVFGDWDFNLRFLQEYDIVVLPEALAYYHHREPSKKKADIYANSIIGAAGSHDAYYTHLRNKFLREDLKSGKVGIGHLVNMSFDLRHASEKQDRYSIASMQAIHSNQNVSCELHNKLQDAETARINDAIIKIKSGIIKEIKQTEQEFLVIKKAQIAHLYALFKPFIWVGIKLGFIKP